MALSREEVDLMIDPQIVTVFRLPCNILGRVVTFWGTLALHNNARGPYKGGVRIAPDTGIEETVELARLMTLKTAAVNIEFGGGKTGVDLDISSMYGLFGKRGRDLEFEKIVTLDIMDSYAQRFRDLFARHVYIPAPDMGTGPEEMAFVYNQTEDPASVTGKPEGVHGWLPGRKESTGYGCAYACLRVIDAILQKGHDESTAAIQGFGNVGQPLASFLTERGTKLVGVTDLYGGAYDPKGLDVEGLNRHVQRAGTVGGFAGALTNDQLFSLDVDVLIPAACSNVIDSKNAATIKARAIVEAANAPTTPGGMSELARKGIYVVPDILANAGGVIASMEEYSRSLSAMKASRDDVLRIVREKIQENWDLAEKVASDQSLSLSEAVIQIALQRIQTAMKSRRFTKGRD